MLKTKQVGKYLVTEMGTLEQVRLRLFLRQVDERMTDKVTKQRINDPELEEVLGSWATVAACTTPLISMDEWTKTPLSILNPIQQAVMELNSGLVGDEEAPAQARKNRRNKSKKFITGKAVENA